jgi:hypothetical protein
MINKRQWYAEVVFEGIDPNWQKQGREGKVASAIERYCDMMEMLKLDGRSVLVPDFNENLRKDGLPQLVYVSVDVGDGNDGKDPDALRDIPFSAGLICKQRGIVSHEYIFMHHKKVAGRV